MKFRSEDIVVYIPRSQQPYKLASPGYNVDDTSTLKTSYSKMSQ